MSNRAVAGRRLFASRADARRFLALVARAVRERRIDIDAYVLLPGRYELLLRSREGRLADAMRSIQDLHARGRNAREGEAGPLFGGRYRAKRIATSAHRVGVHRCLHEVPELRELSDHPAAWPFTCAALSAAGRSPPWLPAHHGAGPGASPALIRRWLGLASSEPEDLDDLLVASDVGLAVWLRRRAEARAEAVALVGDPALARALAEREPPPALAIGLARTVGACRIVDLAARHSIAPSTTHARIRSHLDRLQADARYAHVAARVLRHALEIEYGGSGLSLPEPILGSDDEEDAKRDPDGRLGGRGRDCRGRRLAGDARR